ncbi:hypothetical protein EDB31_1082 [Vibrio crassostreae]|nr:hypothetical protein EDB31_1082 [Vibrio crassostreae]
MEIAQSLQQIQSSYIREILAGVLRPFQRKVQCEPTALYL